MRPSWIGLTLMWTPLLASAQTACGGDPLGQGVKLNAPPYVETLTADIGKGFTSLRRDNGELVWVEWAQRRERGGSYLRAIGSHELSASNGRFSVPAGASFVFKAPGADARNYATDSGFSFPGDRSKLAEITGPTRASTAPQNARSP